MSPCTRSQFRASIVGQEPSVYLDQEPTVVVRRLGPALYLTPQYGQLMLERRVLGFKLAFGFERCDQDGQDKT
jgi:hypothetical protein